MIDLSFRALFAHANGKPYAITTTFDGRDLVNGGMHMAVDVGNFGMDDPIKAVSRRGRGLYHYDGAIGYEDDLGNGWTLQRWHLNTTWAAGLSLIPGRSDVGDWADVQIGQTVGRTGNTGALVNGRPMPAHTHIELERNGQRYDVAPHLLGQPFDPNQENHMKVAGKFVRHIHNRRSVLTGDAHLRRGVLAGEDASLAVMPKGTGLYPIFVVEGRPVGAAADRHEWYAAVLYVNPDQAKAVGSVETGRVLGYVHSSVLGPLEAVEAAPDPAATAALVYEAADATARAARRHADGYRPS